MNLPVNKFVMMSCLYFTRTALIRNWKLSTYFDRHLHFNKYRSKWKDSTKNDYHRWLHEPVHRILDCGHSNLQISQLLTSFKNKLKDELPFLFRNWPWYCIHTTGIIWLTCQISPQNSPHQSQWQDDEYTYTRHCYLAIRKMKGLWNVLKFAIIMIIWILYWNITNTVSLI